MVLAVMVNDPLAVEEMVIEVLKAPEAAVLGEKSWHRRSPSPWWRL